MIEPITTLTNRIANGASWQEAPPPGDFAAVISAHAGDGAGQPHARRGADDPATVGRDVNLAALAAHELVTPGTPRAEVAAAREEARTPGDSAASPESGQGQPNPTGVQARTPGRARVAAPGPPAAAAQASASPTAPARAESPPTPASTPPQSERVNTAGTMASVASAPVSGIAAATSARASSNPPTPQAQSGTVRPPTGPTGRQSPLSVFKAEPLTPRPGTAPEAFAAQLKRGLAAVLRQSGGSVTVRMAPEALGQVRIRLEIGQGHVSARFDVGDHEARRLLESDLDVLRRTLEARGLRVDDLHVTVRPELAGPKDQPADHGGRPASDSPDQREASTGGAGHRDHSAGERADPSDSRQDAALEPDLDPSTVDPWATLSGGAGNTRDGSDVLRLRLDAVA